MPSLWFLEITCTVSFIICLGGAPNGGTEIPRYYKTERECVEAIIVVNRMWDWENTAYKFNCLPVVR